MSPALIEEIIRDFETSETFKGSYSISIPDFRSLLRKFNTSKSDEDILINIYYLVDRTGFQDISLLDILGSFSVCVQGSVQERLLLAFRVSDRGKSGLLSKTDMSRLFALLNSAVSFFGDRPLSPAQLVDLVDSIYTAAGLVDGTVSFVDVLENVVGHPIMEMMLSPQFQGQLVAKQPVSGPDDNAARVRPTRNRTHK